MNKYDDNIPMPAPRTKWGRDLSDMKITQSFFVAGIPKGSSHQVYVETTRKTGFKFRSVETTEGGVLGRRYWRVS